MGDAEVGLRWLEGAAEGPVDERGYVRVHREKLRRVISDLYRVLGGQPNIKADPDRQRFADQLPGFSRVRRIIARELGLEEDRIRPDARLQFDLGMDSLDAVEVTLAMEEEYGLEVPDDAIEEMETVGHIYEYLCERGAITEPEPSP